MRERNTDPKLCAPVNSPLARSLEAQFDGGPIVSFQEIFNKAQYHPKLTDEQKLRNCIIQLSFVLLNSRNEPQIITRGAAHSITDGKTILHSFSSLEGDSTDYPESLKDLKSLLKKNAEVAAGKFTVSPLALVRNLRKGIRYYFIVFAARFAGSVARIASFEDDIYGEHLEAADAIKIPGIRKKNVDTAVLNVLMGVQPLRSTRRDEVRVVVPPKQRLHDGLFLPYHLFISHATADKVGFVSPLVAGSNELGVRSWYDSDRITGGDELRAFITDGINLSRAGVVVFSPTYLKKKSEKKSWIDFELKLLQKRAKETGKKIVVIAHKFTPADIGRYAPDLVRGRIIENLHGPKVCAREIHRAIDAG